MEHCHHEISDALYTGDILGLITLIFMTGLTGSFTHCISMCGPLAIAQTSVRMMTLKPNKMSELQRIKLSFLTPYYLGKATTYCCLGTLLYLFAIQFSNSKIFSWIAALILLATALFYFLSGVLRDFTFLKLTAFKPYKKLHTFIVNKTSHLTYQPYGFRGFLLGMILGLIPCGLVYATLITAATYAPNLLVLNFSLFAFGMATIPGLFVAGYLGNLVLHQHMKVLFSIVMFINCIILVCYALKLL
ncbi:MAG: sulfite exporter TauE/SafE family protein [Rickettsiales bacterium]